MTKREMFDEFAARVAETIKYIVANVDTHKVCEACDCVQPTHRPICVRCKAYRFDHSPEAVQRQVEQRLSIPTEELYFQAIPPHR